MFRWLVALAVCAPGFAAPALATTGPPEQLIPDQLPIPVDHLWLGVEPFNNEPILTGRIGQGARFDKAPWTARAATRDVTPEFRRGGLLRFPDDVRLEIGSEGTHLLPPQSTGEPSGVSVSLWFRHRPEAVKFASVGQGPLHLAPPDGPGGNKVLVTSLTGAHGLADGALVDLQSAGLWNGRWKVRDITATTFTLEGAVWTGSAGFAKYVERGRSWWRPIWSLGNAASAEAWRMALVLDDGVPTVALRHADEELFKIQDAPPQAGYTPTIDDSGWHHVVLRVTREHCAGTTCPSVVNVPYPAQPARFALYVDGAWRGEEIALAPLDLDELVVGELDVPGETYAQPNFKTNPSRLAATMDVDDLMVFDAPLSEGEILELHRWGSAGYTQLFPRGPLATRYPNAPTIAVNAAAAGASAPASDLTGLSSSSFQLLGGLHHASLTHGATAFAQVRVDGYDPSPIIHFNLGNTGLVSVALTDAGLKASCDTGSVTGSYAHDPRQRFSLISLTSPARGPAVLRQDGHQILTLPTGCGVPTSQRTGMNVFVKPGVWLAWAGHFPGAMSPNQLDSFVAPGPRLWNASRARDTALTDPSGLSDLHVEGSAPRALDGGWFTNDGRAAAALESYEQHRATRPHGIWGPATGSLAPRNGTAPLTVSFSVRLPKLAALDYEPTRVRLAERGWNYFLGNTLPDFQVYAVCSLFGAGRDTPEGCYLEIIAGVGKNSPGRRYRVNHKLDQRLAISAATLDTTQQHHVAIAWGVTRTIPADPRGAAGPPIQRREPLVAIDGRVLNQRHQGERNLIEDMGEVPALTAFDPAQAPARWTFGPGGTGRAAASLGDGSIETRTYDVEILDPRVYSYAREDLDAILASGRRTRCEEGGRSFVAPAGSRGGHCGECVADHFAVGGVSPTTRDCRGDEQFTERCASASECAGGAACYRGRCLTLDKAACDAECGELGRACAAVGSSWRCAGCKAGQLRNKTNFAAEDSWEMACSWQPSKEPGESCATDAECTNAWCTPARSGSIHGGVNAPTSTYVSTLTDRAGACGTGYCRETLERFNPTLQSVSWSAPRHCGLDAGTGPGECLRALTRTERMTKTAPDGRAFTSVRCMDGPDAQCVAGTERAWRVLSPQACVAALTEAKQIHAGSCDRWYQAIPAGCRTTEYDRVEDSARRKAMQENDFNKFNLSTLKTAFLGETTPYAAADRARLIKAGVGLLLLDFAAADAATKRRLSTEHGLFLPLRYCATPNAQNVAFKMSHANQVVCQPKLQPNGATCPPPATVGSGRPGWEFCESAFCDDRDTGTCKPGGRTKGELTGGAGNKSRRGRSAVKFGVVRVDDTKVDIKENDKDHSDADPRYTATVGQRYVPCILGKRFPPIDIFSLSIDIDRSKPNCGTEKVTARILGYKINAPKMKGAASCTVVSAAVNADATLCFAGPSCTSTVDNLDSAVSLANLLPKFKVCLPADAIGVKLPEKKKTFFEAVVPITVSIGMTLDPCINAAAGFADNGMPQMEIKPSIAVGVEARAGLGVSLDGNIDISAGAKIALTLVELGFPIRWLFELEDVMKNGRVVLGLFNLNLIRKISLELDILSGWMGLYAELSLGPFGLDWEYPIFSWQGFFFSIDLSKKILASFRLDFQAQFNAALAAGQQPRATCDGNDCLK